MYRVFTFFTLLCFITVSVVAEEQNPPQEATQDPAVEAPCEVPDVHPGPDPWPDPYEVYGDWWFVNQAIADAWTEDDNPFDEDSDWSDVPGEYDEIGVLIEVNIPLQEEENGPLVRYTITIAAGQIDGQPKCWLYDDGGLPRGPGFWWKTCCYSQYVICRIINNILNNVLPSWGDNVCPRSYCSSCRDECLGGDPIRDDPCHSCGFCGGSWILCHIVKGGHC